jgi:serine/threonine protein kinase
MLLSHALSLAGLIFFSLSLKSANIMMSVEGDVKLIDFGLCVDLGEVGDVVHMVGSPFWIPPEMICRQPHNTSVDIWSFGICIMEMALGQPPNRKNMIRAMYSVATGHSPRLPQPSDDAAAASSSSSSSSWWTPEFNDFLDKCLKIDPQERHSARRLLKHEFIAKAAHKKSMRSILQQVFVEKSLSKSLGMSPAF